MAAEQTTWQRDWTVVPGEILVEALEERGMSQSELARRMGRPTKTINEIANGKAAITPETAIQLELTLGISAAFWNNLEASYRAHLARERADAEFATHASWAASFPIKDLVKNNLITPGDTKASKVAALLSFFQVSTPDAWEKNWTAAAATYRRSPAFEASPHASAAWLRWGEIIAADIETEPFDADRFRAVLADVREMTRKDFAMTRARIIDLCASAGVALVITPEFSGTHVSGAARWLLPIRPSFNSASGTRPTISSGSASSTRDGMSSNARRRTTSIAIPPATLPPMIRARKRQTASPARR